MNNLSKIVISSAAGIAVGGALGLLFASETGIKTRKDISKKSKKILGKINEHVGKERLMELKEEFEDQLEKINDRIKKFANIS